MMFLFKWNSYNILLLIIRSQEILKTTKREEVFWRVCSRKDNLSKTLTLTLTAITFDIVCEQLAESAQEPPATVWPHPEEMGPIFWRNTWTHYEET